MKTFKSVICLTRLNPKVFAMIDDSYPCTNAKQNHIHQSQIEEIIAEGISYWNQAIPNDHLKRSIILN